MYTRDYTFCSVYLLTSAAENEPNTVEGSVHGLKGWIDCFEKASLAGVIFAGGVTASGEIARHPALEQAYEAGKAIG